ncbi:hypothetical protein OR620_11565 [Aeromonas hydrophila]|uniref:hypothetical protein n=1 Tax=Aeromonas TaxID=642 RepID=UPI001118F8B3|nr:MULTISPECIES: hypothetical protein [Aeromonas]MBW3797725.1 hypothetical protein [Aeromonas hydrophila]MBW3801665.1 hypothetical protein [Aeromonas hydrophila]MBW3819221.1 hypothetical protein [Aeromonas hydrophila]MCX4104420.1 hypothetical protein [Aeromonas hydrophila]TNJ24007.1 hypothetical protein CF112_02010 [Aeromonas hydrophila]
MIAIVLAMLKMLPVGDKTTRPGENGGEAVSEIALLRASARHWRWNEGEQKYGEAENEAAARWRPDAGTG